MAQSVILQDDEDIIKKSDLDILLSKLEKFEAESDIINAKLKTAEAKIDVLNRCSYGILKLIGLIDPKTNKIWKTISEKKQNPIGKIISGITSTTLKLGKLNMLGSSKESELEMERQFGFVKEFIPLMEEFNLSEVQRLALPEPKQKTIQ